MLLTGYCSVLTYCIVLYISIFNHDLSWTREVGGSGGSCPPQIMIEGQNMHFAPPPKKKLFEWLDIII